MKNHIQTTERKRVDGPQKEVRDRIKDTVRHDRCPCIAIVFLLKIVAIWASEVTPFGHLQNNIEAKNGPGIIYHFEPGKELDASLEIAAKDLSMQGALGTNALVQLEGFRVGRQACRCSRRGISDLFPCLLAIAVDKERVH